MYLSTIVFDPLLFLATLQYYICLYELTVLYTAWLELPQREGEKQETLAQRKGEKQETLPQRKGEKQETPAQRKGEKQETLPTKEG
nr:1342_t:CDS:2 [Entrophospora candida]